MNFWLVAAGFALLFIALLLIIFGSLSGKAEAKFAFGGFIGPFPFGFANDPRMLVLILILSLALVVIVKVINS